MKPGSQGNQDNGLLPGQHAYHNTPRSKLSTRAAQSGCLAPAANHTSIQSSPSQETYRPLPDREGDGSSTLRENRAAPTKARFLPPVFPLGDLVAIQHVVENRRVYGTK